MSVLTRIAVAGFLTLIAASPAHAVSVVEVKSAKGIVAYLSEDHSSQVISVSFAFAGGTALDPLDKQGLTGLGASLFNEGAGDLDSFAFQSALEDRAISLGMSSDLDSIRGSLTTTSPNLPEALRLARMALLQPRHDPEAIERMRREMLVQIAARSEVPGRLASRKLYLELFGGHPYAREQEGTAESVQALTRADVQNWAKTRLARDRLLVGVAGDISADKLREVLDILFADLPATGVGPSKVPAVKVATVGKTSHIFRDLTQSTILIGSPGLLRSDPDWYAATVADYIFGSGSFSSRLMNEVREKRGLAYTVRSGLSPLDSAGFFIISAGTRADKADESLRLIREEVVKMTTPGVTQEEIDGAKQFLTGAWPLRFTTTGRVAELLVAVQRDNLGLDYLDRRNKLIEDVTMADVKRVAQRLYNPKVLTVVVVGPESAGAAPAGSKPAPKAKAPAKKS
jgi:zinc protease